MRWVGCAVVLWEMKKMVNRADGINGKGLKV
jgi:hypothetical protein